MACLRQDFEAWAENEPEEPEGDNITDEQNAAFEEAEKKHEEDVRLYSSPIAVLVNIPFSLLSFFCM